MPRLIPFASTWRQLEDGSEDTTRCGGKDGPAWASLRPGDLLTPIEWSPRIGPRWVCWACGVAGGKASAASGISLPCRHDLEMAECRGPRRGDDLIVLDVESVRLGEITRAEVEREGFPGWGPKEFLRMYAGVPQRSDLASPAVNARRSDKANAARDWTVTRIRFARVGPGGRAYRQAITRELGQWPEIEGLSVERAREHIPGAEGPEAGR
ncbi:MAG: hypothetical protein GY719_26275 [bacterium]|nr:hypothetical protein [bacterium]